MCGIVGVLSARERVRPEKALLLQMADRLHHRGPDDSGYFGDDHAGFGFRRLAIMDLAGGAQPMFNEDRSLVLVCNGEIYNYPALRQEMTDRGHVFQSSCDVEVLLHLYEEYGTSFVGRLNGQFAFCIYDTRRQTFFLARDHVGIAPLFYTEAGGQFIFASEIKAILCHPSVKRKVNLTALDQIFTFPGMVSPATMFEGIHSLKPGHSLFVSEAGIQCAEYWDLDYPDQAASTGHTKEADAIAQLTELLQQAVAYRLQSDVPVGFYLSGGLDSSLVAALINTQNKSIKHSFSIGFPSESQIDEAAYRRQMTALLESTHHEVLFEPDDIAARLKAAVYHAESPLKESYNTCSLALSEEVRRSGIKVVLSGEGADELFAGYVGYKFDRERQRGSDGFAGVEEALERENRRHLWGREDFVYDKSYYEFAEVKRALYSEEVNDRMEHAGSVRAGVVDKSKLAGRDLLHVRSYLDFKLRISDHLVADHGDRVAYANSIEARYPFLDINVIEFARTLPPELKLRDMVEKYILRQCAAPYVPAAIVNREKFSFVAPGSHYLVRNPAAWVEELLSYDRIKKQGYFNPDTVERLKKIYRSEKFQLNQSFETDLLMIVLTFGIFLEVFDVEPL